MCFFFSSHLRFDLVVSCDPKGSYLVAMPKYGSTSSQLPPLFFVRLQIDARWKKCGCWLADMSPFLKLLRRKVPADSLISPVFFPLTPLFETRAKLWGHGDKSSTGTSRTFERIFWTKVRTKPCLTWKRTLKLITKLFICYSDELHPVS